jgi:hypothetical protein
MNKLSVQLLLMHTIIGGLSNGASNCSQLVPLLILHMHYP